MKNKIQTTQSADKFRTTINGLKAKDGLPVFYDFDSEQQAEVFRTNVLRVLKEFENKAKWLMEDAAATEGADSDGETVVFTPEEVEEHKRRAEEEIAGLEDELAKDVECLADKMRDPVGLLRKAFTQAVENVTKQRDKYMDKLQQYEFVLSCPGLKDSWAGDFAANAEHWNGLVLEYEQELARVRYFKVFYDMMSIAVNTKNRSLVLGLMEGVGGPFDGWNERKDMMNAQSLQAGVWICLHPSIFFLQIKNVVPEADPVTKDGDVVGFKVGDKEYRFI